eukprot:scaffold421212_cov46-Attheya_sp.AAC.2
MTGTGASAKMGKVAEVTSFKKGGASKGFSLGISGVAQSSMAHVGRPMQTCGRTVEFRSKKASFNAFI